MAQQFDFVTPAGRLVAGSFTEVNKTDHQNKPLDPAKYNRFVGLAFPKTAAQWWDEQGELGAVFTAIRQAAADHYKGAEFQNAAFAWKIDNGDDVKHAGKEGYAGHWILKFTRYETIGGCRVYNTANQEIIDPMQLKKGYYYRISGSAKANGNTGSQAGVYMNMNMAQLVGIGAEIVSGPTAAAVFGTPATLPAGVQAAPAIGGMPAAPSLPLPTPPAAPAAPGAVPAAPAAPAPNFAQGGGYAPVEVKRIYQGVAYTEAALRASNHTDAMIATYPIAQ